MFISSTKLKQKVRGYGDGCDLFVYLTSDGIRDYAIPKGTSFEHFTQIQKIDTRSMIESELRYYAGISTEYANKIRAGINALRKGHVKCPELNNRDTLIEDIDHLILENPEKIWSDIAGHKTEIAG